MLYSKKIFYMMYIHKRHILRPTNMGYWFQKKSKFEQNSLFVVLCLLCAHHTTYFVRKQKFYNVLRYLYYHSIWSCTIMTKCRQEIRKCCWISLKKEVSKYVGNPHVFGKKNKLKVRWKPACFSKEKFFSSMQKYIYNMSDITEIL